MAWTIEYDPRFEKDLHGLDKRIQEKILHYMESRIAPSDDPKSFGKALRHSQKGLWRYRVPDYRIICEIQQDRGKWCWLSRWAIAAEYTTRATDSVPVFKLTN